MPRIALGLSYRGTAYRGWQSQSGVPTVQDALEAAIAAFVGSPLRVTCAGRTDAGVHALGQVVHLDTAVDRRDASWVRGVNTFLPADIAVRWARVAPDGFDARRSAVSRRYRYTLQQGAVRPALLTGLVGWTHWPLQRAPMLEAAALLLGEHDFSAFRASACQAASPVKTVHAIDIAQQGSTWTFDFHASAFLHHMVRNIMGCLLEVGSGARPPDWIAEVLASRSRARAAPTFMPDGLVFVGPAYPAECGIPDPDPGLPLLQS